MFEGRREPRKRSVVLSPVSGSGGRLRGIHDRHRQLVGRRQAHTFALHWPAWSSSRGSVVAPSITAPTEPRVRGRGSLPMSHRIAWCSRGTSPQHGRSRPTRPRRARSRSPSTPSTPDRTRVVLTHRHLDRHSDDWEGIRDAMSSGWSLDGLPTTLASRPAAATDQRRPDTGPPR